MSDFDQVFAELREILLPYARKLDRKVDRPDRLRVDTKHVMKNGKPLFFGAVQTGKNYVSYHLMPVYVNPDLLDTVSPALKKRMQGKSCFNFTSVDTALFEEVAALTKRGSNTTRRRGMHERSPGRVLRWIAVDRAL